MNRESSNSDYYRVIKGTIPNIFFDQARQIVNSTKNKWGRRYSSLESPVSLKTNSNGEPVEGFPSGTPEAWNAYQAARTRRGKVHALLTRLHGGDAWAAMEDPINTEIMNPEVDRTFDKLVDSGK